MNFNEYQKLTAKTAIYSKKDKNFNYPVSYPVLGLVSEAGEIAGKIKKIYRDGAGKITKEQKTELAKELGDVLWYVSQLSSELRLSLHDIASENIAKLKSRKKRGTIIGNGDNR
ncbi:MAG: nucleoside triphosphate pyrophosphohydrolase family protein [bacterium]|nr:nucleoside triphosphate pyrophosphohydrolase family protein [bacterium]